MAVAISRSAPPFATPVVSPPTDGARSPWPRRRPPGPGGSSCSGRRTPTRPPSITIAATPSILWPPDGRLADVAVAVQVSDRCDPVPAVVLSGVASSEPGTGRPGPWMSGAGTGTDDRAVSLRADRAGAGPGRIYTL